MSNHKNLLFFNKEGDYLNFKYNEQVDRFEGDLLFHHNSTDTFKTIGLYTLEKVDSFEFESPGELSLNKFQLFNEYGLFFYNSLATGQQIRRIEPINNDPSFYSKWIYGDNFEKKFPIGTIIVFDSPLLEFTNLTQTYTVVSTKKGAIMIITPMDNATFESTFYFDYQSDSTYIGPFGATFSLDNPPPSPVGKKISAINAIGVYNYVDTLYNDKLSSWNEPSFYDKLYPRKKLNVVNSINNDGVYTVLDENLTDNKHYEYFTYGSSGNDLLIELVSKTDLPRIYEGEMKFMQFTQSIGTQSVIAENRIMFTDSVPGILKPGREFKVIGSTINQNFFTVAPLPTFEGNTQQTIYSTQSQVLWNNKIYECILGYTHSHGYDSPAYLVTPDNTQYWTENITHIKVDQTVGDEYLSSGQVYLTTDRVYFGYGFTVSTAVTLASAAEKYKSDLSSFNVDLYYMNNILKADLMHPSKYLEVNFYHTQKGPTFSIGQVKQTNERIIRIVENLKSEINYDYSERNSYKIVFTDLDIYGLKLKINKELYQEELSPIYSGGVYDVPRTIDRTLRNWLTRYYVELIKIGIVAEVQYVGSIFSPFVNSIKLTSVYPNVPMQLNEVLVGTTADYHIEHSTVLFNQDITNKFYGLGSSLIIDINGDEYDIDTIYQTGTFSQYPDIPATLQSWVDEHSDYLRTFGIIVSNINNMLKFDVKRLDRRLSYSIDTSKSNLPGQYDYTVRDKVLGNLGCLITSNEVTLDSNSPYSFEEVGFATGMVFSINNTYYNYNNQEYNIQFLDPNVMNLSYQGPFWGIDDGICNSSAFITLAFNTGFGQTACVIPSGPTGSLGGPFNSLPGGAFNTAAFVLTFNPNTYVMNTYNLATFPGTNDLVDLIYVQLSNSIYAFGENLVVLDSFLASYITTINLPGNTQSIEVEYNTYNNYLYCLSRNLMYVVDPLLNYVVASMSFAYDAGDMEINPINGDVYVTYTNYPNISIYDYTNTLVTTLGTSSANFPPSATSCGKMVFNEFENDMYIVTNANEVLRVNGGGVSNGTNRTIQTTYGIPGLTNSIFYEPVNESVYAYGSTNLYRIDNGVTASLSITTQPFDDIIFNNLTLEMNVSDSSTTFRSLNLSNNNVSISSGVSNYGYLALNQFDGDVYMSCLSTNNIIVVRPTTGQVVHTEPMAAQTTRIIYNPERESVWAIQPSLNTVIEIDVTLNSSIVINPPTFAIEEENQYGTLSPDYVPHPDIWLKSREYTRRPRENFEGESIVRYYFRWYTDTIPDMFMYDFSGDQLPISGSYAYTGVKPLSPAILNKKPNRDLTKTASPEYQQTIFDRVTWSLSYIDDEDDLQTAPLPLQLFLGYKSENEGSLRSVLQMFKKEVVEYEFESTNLNGVVLTIETLGPEDKRGRISINQLSNEFFTGKGFKKGQLIVLYIRDVTNKKDQYLSPNNGLIVKIREVFSKSMIVDFLNRPSDFLIYEKTAISNFPKTGNTTYLKTMIRVVDKEIGRFMVYGQTEEEDIRFKVELGNQGKLINPDEVFIFKEYDILEGGIDWPFLNKKRKEMLMMRSMIYPYIGAYKSIINAINFFGYNDLQLNEYYRDINPNSEKFLQLFKIEIPDIFDNTVEGFNESEFFKNNFPNENYEETKMFNLTYFITDKEGNNQLSYSVDEVIIKLQGLKYWLRRNIIPLTHKIMDITGVSYFGNTSEIVHTSYDVRHFKNYESLTPISFKLNEVYLMPVNTGSTVYNCVLDFYSIIEGVGADKNPTGLRNPPKLYNGFEAEIPDYFTIDIRTYKTYPEWAPFVTYTKGEKITYNGKLYESFRSNNKLNNPRKYENVKEWRGGNYEVTSKVKYSDEYYVLSGLAFYATASATASFSSGVNPLKDTGNWLNITEWKEISYEPVQKITEYRKIDKSIRGASSSTILPSGTNFSINSATYSVPNKILPFNFTIDSNIDPFLVIEVSCENGYGATYRDKKNYEIRGIKDITKQVKYIDPIGPFVPIKPVY